MKVRFIILLPPRLSKFVAKHSKDAKKNFGTYFVIDNKKLFSHITLFKARINKRDLENLYKKIHARSKALRPFKIHLRDCYLNGAWIFTDVLHNKKISDLRRTLIKDSASAGGKFLKPTHRFQPHVTLAKLKISRERESNLSI